MIQKIKDLIASFNWKVLVTFLLMIIPQLIMSVGAIVFMLFLMLITLITGKGLLKGHTFLAIYLQLHASSYVLDIGKAQREVK